MYDHSVVAWDGTAAGDAALAWATASPFGGHRCTVLRLVRPHGSATDVRAALEAEIARRAAAHPERPLDGVVLTGDLEAELERRSGRTALVVLGTAARDGHRSRLTLATRVAARAHGPVAVVPETARPAADGPVLVGVDGTAASFAAARIAARLAAAGRRGLTVLHAWQEVGDPDLLRRAGIDGAAPDPDVSRVLPQAHRAIGEEVLAVLRGEFPHVDARLEVVHGPPPAALTEAAADAALLVVGKHARFTSSSLLLGSVAHAVLLTSPAPVLVVGRQDAESRRHPHAEAAG